MIWATVLPWFFANSDPLTCRALDLARTEFARSRVYLIVRGGITSEVAQCLSDAGLHGDVATLGTIRTLHYGELYVIAHRPAGVTR